MEFLGNYTFQLTEGLKLNMETGSFASQIGISGFTNTCLFIQAGKCETEMVLEELEWLLYS